MGGPVAPTCRATPQGFALANKGIDTRTLQAYLGHRNIQSTVRYTGVLADVQALFNSHEQKRRDVLQRHVLPLFAEGLVSIKN